MSWENEYGSVEDTEEIMRGGSNKDKATREMGRKDHSIEVQQHCVGSCKMEVIMLDTEAAQVDNLFWLLKSGTGIQVVKFKGERENNQGRRGKKKKTQKVRKMEWG